MVSDGADEQQQQQQQQQQQGGDASRSSRCRPRQAAIYKGLEGEEA